MAVYAINGTVENCTFEVGNWTGKNSNNTPTAAVATSGNGTVTVTNCTITTEAVAFFVYTSGGTINATDCTIDGNINGELDMTYSDAVAKITVNGEVVFENSKK